VFVELGGELRDNQKVTDLSGDREMLRVVTHTGAVYQTRKLVITAGAWAPSIIAKLGVHLPFKFDVRMIHVYNLFREGPMTLKFCLLIVLGVPMLCVKL